METRLSAESWSFVGLEGDFPSLDKALDLYFQLFRLGTAVAQYMGGSPRQGSPVRAGYITVHIVAALLACLAVPVSSQTRKIDRTSGRDLPPSAGDIDVPFCAADVRQDFRQGLNVSRGLPDGEPLSFQQVPPILRPDHVGSFGLLEFAVLGDYEAVIFERQDPSAESGAVVERWQRTTSTTVSGRMVSLFEPRWADHVWSERLRHERHGFDRPYVFWGRVVIPSSNLFAGPEKRPLYLRVGSTGVPLSYVRQIAPDVQYASHVVNLVIPAFGDSRVSLGTYDFDLPTAATQSTGTSQIPTTASPSYRSGHMFQSSAGSTSTSRTTSRG